MFKHSTFNEQIDVQNFLRLGLRTHHQTARAGGTWLRRALRSVPSAGHATHQWSAPSPQEGLTGIYSSGVASS